MEDECCRMSITGHQKNANSVQTHYHGPDSHPVCPEIWKTKFFYDDIHRCVHGILGVKMDWCWCWGDKGFGRRENSVWNNVCSNMKVVHGLAFWSPDVTQDIPVVLASTSIIVVASFRVWIWIICKIAIGFTIAQRATTVLNCWHFSAWLR